MGLVIRRSPLGDSLEVPETFLEILADHLVHVDEDAHHLADEEIGASMAQVTSVDSPFGSIVNEAVL